MQLPLTAGAIELGPKRNDRTRRLELPRDIRPDGSYVRERAARRYVIRARGETESDVASMFGMFTLDISGSDRTSVNITMSPGAIVWDSSSEARAAPGFRRTADHGRPGAHARRQHVRRRADWQHPA